MARQKSLFISEIPLSVNTGSKAREPDGRSLGARVAIIGKKYMILFYHQTWVFTRSDHEIHHPPGS
jgi:hypothetical protein